MCIRDRNTAVGTILDDDANDPGTGVAFDNTAVTVTEGDPGDTVEATFTVNFTGTIAPGETVTVDYATADNTALDASDYTAQTGTITFDENTSSVAIVIPIVNDNIIEATEAFDLILSNITSNIGVGFVDGNTTNTAVGTILDDDANDPGTGVAFDNTACLLYTSPSPRDQRGSRMPSSA